MLLLDTHVLSELRNVGAGRADAWVAAWAASVDAAQLYISAISMELELGVLAMERKDAAKGALLRTWLEAQVLPEFAERTQAVDSAALRPFACA